MSKLGVRQLDILSYLEEDGPATRRDILLDLGTPMGTLHKVLVTLLYRKLITKEGANYSITKEGTEALSLN